MADVNFFSLQIYFGIFYSAFQQKYGTFIFKEKKFL